MFKISYGKIDPNLNAGQAQASAVKRLVVVSRFRDGIEVVVDR
jgi:hypothetical protein